jgi:hypothetical protein
MFILVTTLSANDFLQKLFTLLGVELEIHLKKLGEHLNHRRVDIAHLLVLALEMKQHLLPAFAKGRHLLTAHQNLGHRKVAVLRGLRHGLQALQNEPFGEIREI